MTREVFVVCLLGGTIAALIGALQAEGDLRPPLFWLAGGLAVGFLVLWQLPYLRRQASKLLEAVKGGDTDLDYPGLIQLLSEIQPAHPDGRALRRQPHRALMRSLRELFQEGTRNTLCVPAPPGFGVDELVAEYFQELRQKGWTAYLVQSHNAKSRLDFLSLLLSVVGSPERSVAPERIENAIEALSNTVQNSERPVALAVLDLHLLLQRIPTLGERGALIQDIVSFWCPTLITSMIRLDAFVVREGLGSYPHLKDLEVELCDDWASYTSGFGLPEARRQEFSGRAFEIPALFSFQANGGRSGRMERERLKLGLGIWWSFPKEMRSSLLLAAAGNRSAVDLDHLADFEWGHIVRVEGKAVRLRDPLWRSQWESLKQQKEHRAER